MNDIDVSNDNNINRRKKMTRSKVDAKLFFKKMNVEIPKHLSKDEDPLTKQQSPIRSC